MKYKKSLGQNFFNNPGLADKIVGYIAENKPSALLEIGPGAGFFTQRLIQFTKKLFLVEKDTMLSNELTIRYPQVQVFNVDILDFDLSLLPRNTIVFGSLPYNVSKQIIRKCIESDKFSKMFFIVQKEVADKYLDVGSSLYAHSKIYVDTKHLLDISPGSFIPRPKVNSSLICMTPNSNQEKLDIAKVNTFIRLIFQSPRKTLKNNLRNSPFVIPAEYENKRAESLTFEEIINLCK